LIATPDNEFENSESARIVRQVARKFAEGRIAPIADKLDREAFFSRELWPEMGQLGLHGIAVPDADGGLGMGYLEHSIAVEEISRASASIGMSYGAHSNLCINQLVRWANTETCGI
jgi:isovaleryl-CoA dehydrogenase